jgi:4-amino-4-deoxy-L-arabinose transferase-like glycosyltransferase
MRLSAPIVLFTCALVVRLLFNVYVTGIEDAGLEVFPDGKAYDALGWSLANGSGFRQHHAPDTSHPPGYPFFLAAVYALFGHSYAAVKILQSIIGALVCVMVMVLGERLFTRRVGMIAGALAAGYPFLVIYTGFMLSEGLFIFLSMVFLYALVRLRETFSMRWVAAAGLVLGLMNLTRPVTFLLPVVVLGWLWIDVGSKRRAGMIAGLLTLWMLVPIVPWTVRNYLVTQSFILIDDHQWETLYAGNNDSVLHNPEKIGGWVQSINVDDYRGEYLAFIRHTLVDKPMEMLRLEFYKLVRFWSIIPSSSKTTERETIISLCSYGLLLPFFVTGLALSLKLPKPPWLLVAWILYFCFMTLIVYGSTRLRSPIEPVLLLFSAIAMERTWVWLRSKRRRLDPRGAW